MKIKLQHLSHIEDFIFSQNYNTTIHFFEEIVASLSGQSSKIKYQKKIDGAPSVILGRDPENGKLFVATKSLFNKIPKINYTSTDVDDNHKGGLADKLKSLLKHAAEIKFKGTAIQGDFMFSSGDIKIKDIKGKSYHTFTPNTITYAIPTDSPLAPEMKKAVGIVWHTTYHGNSIADMSASFKISKPPSSSNTWNTTTDMDALPKSVLLSKIELTLINGVIKKLKTFKLTKSAKNSIMSHEQLIKQFINQEIRKGVSVPTYKSFVKYVDEYYNKKKNKLKTPKGQQKHEDVKQTILNNFKIVKLSVTQIFSLFEQLLEIKELIIKKLDDIPRYSTFIKTGTGFKSTSDEGYVAISGDSAVKLISRMEFSRNNFMQPKDWK